MITCTANNRIYIGSSQDMRARCDKHRRQLRAGKHHNIHLQRAWNAYGESAFEFSVLEFVMPWALLDREQHWIDELKPFQKNGFNMSTVAGSPMLGRTHSAETKAKIGAWGKGRTAVNKGKPSPRRGQKQSPEAVEKMAASKRGKSLSTEQRAKYIEPSSKNYIVTSPDGTEMVIKGLLQFSRANGLNPWTMYRIVDTDQTYKGWKTRHA